MYSNYLPSHNICCDHSANNTQIHIGYPADKITVIPNGYDFSPLLKDDANRAAAQAKLGVSEEDIIVGVVGRFNLLKDFQTFIFAASLVATICPIAKFLMV